MISFPHPHHSEQKHCTRQSLQNPSLLLLSCFIYSLLLLFNYSCPYFPPTLSSSPPNTTSHHHSYPTLAFSIDPVYMILDDPSLYFLCYPPPLPYGYCQCLWLYFASFFALLIRFHIGEIIWYLSFTTWLISLSKILSSSIPLLLQRVEVLSFCCVLFHCVNVPQYFDPLIY